MANEAHEQLPERFRVDAMKSGLLFAAVALAACGGERTEFPFATYGPEWNADDALLAGELVREGPCLYVVEPQGFVTPGGRVLLAFGPVTTWDEGSEVVEYFGRELRVGQGIQAGGSIASAPLPATSWIRKPDESCDVRAVWLVSQP